MQLPKENWTIEQMYKTFDRKLKIEQQQRGKSCTLEEQAVPERLLIDNIIDK